ncbi:MAG: DHA2 family efflux MFS transporter permease subunit [Baekduia sp.]
MTAPPATGPSTAIDRPLVLTSLVVILGAFMTILDTTIVNVAIDTLSRDFDTDLKTIQWVSTGYLIALATVIPLTGWAADRFGTKRLYMMSVALFVAGSALAGTAQSAEQLIFYRVLQGLGGGMVMPAGITMLTRAAGQHRIGKMMGIVGVPMLLGPIVGPILGGWLVDGVSWRWIFYVNIPVGIATLVAAQRILPRDRPNPHERLDWIGLTMLSPGLTAFVYGLAEVAAEGGVSSTKAWLPMAIGVTLIALFVRHALRTEQALLDLRLMREKTVMRASSATTMLFGGAFFGTMLMLPLYYQVVRGSSALEAGLLLAPNGVAAAIAMPIAGRYTDRHGAGHVVRLGLLFLGVGLFGFTHVSTDTSFWFMAGCQVLLGLGMGSAMMPSMAAAYQQMKHEQVARATTALNILQRAGGAIGIALLSVVLTHQLTSTLPGGAGENGLSGTQSLPPQAREQMLPAVAHAFGHTFWWALAIAVVAVIPSLWLPTERTILPGEELAAPPLMEGA